MHADLLNIPEPTEQQLRASRNATDIGRWLLGYEDDAIASKNEETQDPRSVNVVYNGNWKGGVKTATKERLAVIERYAAQVAAGEDIGYDINEDRQYAAELRFAEAARRYYKRFEE